MSGEIYGVNPGRVNKGDSIVNWGELLYNLAQYTNNNFLDSIGNSGSQFESGVNNVTSANGTYFYCIIPNEDTVINTMTVDAGWADYSGEQVAAGVPIYTRCTAIQLTSGSITAYQRSL